MSSRPVWSEYPHLEEELIALRDDSGLEWKEIAEIISNLAGREVTDNAVRFKYNRLKRASGDRGETPGEESPYQVDVPYAKREYTFTGDEYVFVVNGEQVAWPREVWEEVVAYYSAEGADLTQHQIAMKFGANKKVVEACLRQYGHYKARPPVTREELAEALKGGDTEPLMQRAIEVAEHQFSAKLRGAKLKHLERENEELKREIFQRGEILDEVRELIREMGDAIPPAPVHVVKRASPSGPAYTLHAPIFDLHIGLHTMQTRGWTTDYDSDIACQYVQGHAEETVRRIQARGGRCETAVLSIGGDTLHSIMGKTVSGRQVGSDKPDRFLVRAAVRAFRGWIETVRPYADEVKVIGVGGNHDGPLGEILLDILAVAYEGASDVTVDTTPSKQAFFIKGDTLHIIDHGESFTNVTAPSVLATAERIARRVAGAHYYRVRRIVFYVGHMHHREGARTPALDSTDKTQGHMEIIRVPVFCASSDFEELLGFWNEQMADIFFLDEKGRISAIERLYAEHLAGPTGFPGIQAQDIEMVTAAA